MRQPVRQSLQICVATRCLAVGVVLALSAAAHAEDAEIAAHGVRVWVLDGECKGDLAAIVEQGPSQPKRTVRPPTEARGDVVLVSDRLVVSLARSTGQCGLYSRAARSLQERCTVSWGLDQPLTKVAVVEGDDKVGPGVALYAQAMDKPAATVHLNRLGIVRLAGRGERTLTVSQCRNRYGLLPSFVGTDLLYDPAQFPKTNELFLPSMGWYVGLVAGGDSLMVAVWTPEEQVPSLGLGGQGEGRLIDRFVYRRGHMPFYLTFIDAPDIWHAVPLEDDFLERDVTLDWRPPFEAKWIGHAFVKTEGMHFPFYFLHAKTKLWARAIRGWHIYPVWFNGDKPTVRFSKKCPPTDELLIYYLENAPAHGERSTAPTSPVEILVKCLAPEQAGTILDREGVKNRPLMPHGRAVCGMIDILEPIFTAQKEVEEADKVRRLADDIHRFIRLVRERAFEFDALSKDIDALLQKARKDDPNLAKAFEPVAAVNEEMKRKFVHQMAKQSLDEVRQWTDGIKALTKKNDKNNQERFLGLAFNCRSVASTQDDQVRALNVVGMQMMEAAARGGVVSPTHARLAKQIIDRVRQTLRRPCIWEPRRVYRPKPDPNGG